MIGRRAFLASGIGALASASALGQEKQEPRKVKSVLWLWMDGGASQIDTWDPKPGHPAGAGLKAIDTSVPGIVLSELMPRCAAQMHRLSVIRTARIPQMFFASTPDLVAEAMHCSTIPGCDEVSPATGTILAFSLAPPEPPVPAFVAIDSLNIPEADYFPVASLPFHVGPALEKEWAGAGPATPAAEILLASQDEAWEKERRYAGAERLAEARARAQMLRNPRFRAAFRTDGEPEPLRKEYGPGFGRRCLQARRLVEAGATVVEIAQHGWNRSQESFEAIRSLASELDQGLGTLIKDLAERDLLKDTAVICIGPGGRSPEPNPVGGRDPGLSLYSVVMAGGSLRGGRVHGDTGADGKATKPAVPHADLHATLFKACGVDQTRRYATPGHTRHFVTADTGATLVGRPINAFFE